MNPISHLKKIHTGRSFFRLATYFIILLVLLPFSLTLDFLRNTSDFFYELINDISYVVKRWAYQKIS